MEWLRQEALAKWNSFKINYKLEMLQDVNGYLDDLYYVFVIIGIIGMIFNIAGEKETGTKITSLSVLTYLLSKVVFLCLL